MINSTNLRVAGFWDGIQGHLHAPGEVSNYAFRTGNAEMRSTKKHLFEAKVAGTGRIVYRLEFTVDELEKQGWRIEIKEQPDLAQR